jgi:ribose transport system permease protein
VALAVVVPMAAGKFDLSVGYTVGLSHVLVIGLMVKSGFAWPVACMLGIVAGVVIGLVNGLLVAFARIDSFIATLAVGTFAFGVTNWYTQGIQLAGALPTGFVQLTSVNIATYVPLPVVYALVVCILLWLVLEFLPIGRRLYAIGMNPQAAELIGVRVNLYVIVAMMAAGAFAGLAGVLLASQLRAGNPGVGAEYLLPAFVGAFLGSTSVRPGRPNVWGTVLAVVLLAIGINGLEHLGAQFYVSSLFNGAALVLAVGIAGYAARRRERSRRPSRVDQDK